MIAADTSTWVAFLEGDAGEDVRMLTTALEDRLVVMPPVVLTELLSDPNAARTGLQVLRDLPLMDISTGFWQRAGELRSHVLAKGRKARLGDALIAQICIDNRASLLTRDRDFRVFADAADLDIVCGAAYLA